MTGPNESTWELPGWVPAWATLVRADNPSPMTLDGTNTWVVRGGGSAGCVVIDPGPLLERHLERVAEHGPVLATLLTHGHPDHAEGARRFAELTGSNVLALDPAHAVGGDVLVADGEPLTVAGVRIRTFGTPGHTSDSVSFVIAPEDDGRSDGGRSDGGTAPGGGLSAGGAWSAHVVSADGGTAPGDGLSAGGDRSAHGVSADGATAGGRMVEGVLTGDTILGRGTTVVAWPDGELGDYLRSLERLRGLGSIPVLPGHGPVLPDLAKVAGQYLDHRAARLGQVEKAVAAGDRTPAEVVARVYADVDRAVWPAAELSVRAQLDYLFPPSTGAPGGRRSEPPRPG